MGGHTYINTYMQKTDQKKLQEKASHQQLQHKDILQGRGSIIGY